MATDTVTSMVRDTIDGTQPTLLAVDGNSLAHRAYHAYKQRIGEWFKSEQGDPLWAVYGFWALLVGICNKVQPDRILLGFDDPGFNRRKTIHPDYKGQRPPKPADLVSQLEAIQQLGRDLGLHVVMLDGWEADDVVGSASTQAKTHGWRSIVATSDRDAYQLVDTNTRLLRLGSGLANATFMDPDTITKETGVTPSRYVEYAALRGDVSDNLPGVDGIGPKTASKVVNHLSVFDAVKHPEIVSEILTVKQTKLFKKQTGRVELNLDLMQIHTSLDCQLENTSPTKTGNEIVEVFNRWELPTLASRGAETFSTTQPTHYRNNDLAYYDSF